MRTHQSISREILIVVFLSATLSLVAWGAFESYSSFSKARHKLQDSLSLKVNRLSKSLVYPTWNLSQEDIEESISIEMQEEDTLAILLRREDGRILAARARTPQNRIVPFTDSQAERHILAAAFAHEEKPITKNKIQIGTVAVYVSATAMRADRWRLITSIFLQTATLATIISVTIYYTLRRRIIVPIHDLEKSVRAISAENLSPSLTIVRNDEIGRLAESFNQMGRALQQSFSSQEALTGELRKREEQFRNITSNVPSAIYRIAGDRERTLLFVSEYITSILGVPAADFIGRQSNHFRRMILPDDRELLAVAEKAAVANRSSYDVKYRISDHAGRIRWIHEIGRCSGSSGEWYLDGVLIDDTELHEKDTLLIQAQKMETVGVLAGGIAHDFNNILSGIMGSVSMLKFKLAEMPESSRDLVDKYIALIEKSSLRAADMTRQLLSMSKPNIPALQPIDLVVSLQHVISICQNTFDKSVSLSADISVGNAPVSADPVQIEQVLLNLCVNATHALTIMRQPSAPWGGDVHLSLNRISADTNGHLLLPASPGGVYWELSITDNGVGMDENTLANVFTPFYTTKLKGAGSGLGLSMAYNIVTQHNGFIRVQSKPGVGSTFKVYLPVLEGVLAEVCPSVHEDEFPHGTGTILIVDDEEVLRDNAARILTMCGYDVLFAADGEEAVRQVEAHRDEIRLVLLDMVMPVVSGREAFYRIREINPRIRVLLSSGNRLDDRVVELLQAGVDDFINKPYTLPELSRRVHDQLQPALPDQDSVQQS